MANPHLSLSREGCWGRDRAESVGNIITQHRRLALLPRRTIPRTIPSEREPQQGGGEMPFMLGVLGSSEFGSVPKRTAMTAKCCG